MRPSPCPRRRTSWPPQRSSGTVPGSRHRTLFRCAYGSLRTVRISSRRCGRQLLHLVTGTRRALSSAGCLRLAWDETNYLPAGCKLESHWCTTAACTDSFGRSVGANDDGFVTAALAGAVSVEAGVLEGFGAEGVRAIGGLARFREGCTVTFCVAAGAQLDGSFAAGLVCALFVATGVTGQEQCHQRVSSVHCECYARATRIGLVAGSRTLLVWVMCLSATARPRRGSHRANRRPRRGRGHCLLRRSRTCDRPGCCRDCPP